ncbi:dipeptide ABC transporter ATP-binding protein [Nesterenkonia ebinurensis]|uniref:dipeptide ABC transporter ATP-binding protein n=1 Tax=Nesterenkonia ebinurensis TaxID=2608252 RepID=UPI00123CAC81|nr:ABC transporter ATP-binding protein [Nesterenkonia ebinurensis]
MSDMFFRIENLHVGLNRGDSVLPLVDDVSIEIKRGETLCVVGESGSGKSVTFLGGLRLLDYTAPIVLEGKVLLEGKNLLELSQNEMAQVRGNRVAFIFQEAMEALNPAYTVGRQLVESYVLLAQRRGHRDKKKIHTDGAIKALELLQEVGMHEPEVVLKKFPHQLSGGMQQRVMIAMALIGDPELLIADEPTTALDVTIQAEILTLLRRLQQERGMACVLITHDMGVASEIADRIAVLYAGQIIEVGPIKKMLTSPQHPYTKALLECVPRPNLRLDGRLRTIAGNVPAPGQVPPGDRFAPRNPLASEKSLREPPPIRFSENDQHMVRSWDPITNWTPELVDRLTGWDRSSQHRRMSPLDEVIIELKNVNKTYAAREGITSLVRRFSGQCRAQGTRAVKDLSLNIYRGEFFGIVGETGSGKSTLGQLIMDLEQPDPGSEIRVADLDISAKRNFTQEKKLRRQVQMVFQNPQDSLDPRRTVEQSIAEPLYALTDLSRSAVRARMSDMLDAVGLPLSVAKRPPGELSGGQRQRVALARALGPKPSIIVADEPTSALDVSVQGQIVNLLLDLQAEFELTYVFITHNLSLITAVADRVGVMSGGKLVEVDDAETLVESPGHPYTKKLLAANPDPFAEMGKVGTLA